MPRLLQRRNVMVWLLLLLAMAAGHGAQSTSPPIFPRVSGYNLEKARVTLPADLHSDRNLLLLYFKLDQQPDVNAWNTALEQWRAQDPSLVTYDCLVSPRTNAISRWWQNSSLRSDLTDTRRWSTTLPLYVDKMQFLKDLGISREKQVVVLLIDRSGHVLMQVSGPPTQQNLVALRGALGIK